MKDFRAALEQGKEAVSLLGSERREAADAKLFFRVGLCHLALGNLEDACAALRDAHSILPADASIQKKLKEVKDKIETNKRNLAKRLKTAFGGGGGGGGDEGNL